MTPFEIALNIRNRSDDNEPLRDFVLRTMADERRCDFNAALELLTGWESALADIQKMLDIMESVLCETPDATISALIRHKRGLGYDPALEALLARRWRCPHCKQFSTINEVKLLIGDDARLPVCVNCGEEGIAPVDTKPRLDVRHGGKSGLRPT